MNLGLSEEQKIIQSTIRKFVQEELAQVVEQLGIAEEFPLKIFKGMPELGFLGMILPPEYGGSRSDELSLAIAIEEITQSCTSTADILDSTAIIGTVPIYHYSNDEQK